jgi:hypothetical protein
MTETKNPADILWCCHVRGPDDVHAAPDYATALKWSDSIAELDRKMATEDGKGAFGICTPFMNAVPAVWPHSAESHATDLPKSIEYFSAPDSGAAT